MNNYNYKLVVFKNEDKLKSILYDNSEVICESEDISFWLKNYKLIFNKIDNDNILCLYFNNNFYKGIIYNNKYEEILHEADGINLNNCLNNLNFNLKLSIERKKKWI